MVSGLDDYQFIVGCGVDKAVLVIDPPGPEAGKVAAQRFWFSRALERRAPGFLDQPEQAAQHLLVGHSPVREVLPALRVEDDVSHRGLLSSAMSSSSSMVMVIKLRPLRTSSAAAMRRAAFAGERSR